jgi:FHS family Na+ dependent glucose MFS transporter 1
MRAISLTSLVALSKNDAVRRTLGYYSLFICLGLNTAVIGPTLPALADQTRTRVSHMGLVFLAGSIGFTLGTALGGRVFDRMRGHPVLGLCQLAAAAMIALVPVTPWFWLLLLVLACKGMAEGLIDTGGNTLLVWTHKEKVGPYMNGLHFFFGLGAFLAPFLVAQVVDVAGGYRWAYWTLAAFAALTGLRMLTLSASPQPVRRHDEKTPEGASARVYYPLVIAAALFLFFYVGAEIAFGGWIYTYAVTLKLASAVEAAYLTSGFWLSFTIGRLISIPMATRFSPKQIVPAALLSCLVILVLVIAMPGSSLALWLGAVGLGFCMAPIWPTGFTLAGQSLQLTARVSGIILLGGSFGGMVLPSLAGQVINFAGPRAMVYLVFGSLVCNLMAFAGMLRLRPARPSRPQGSN